MEPEQAHSHIGEEPVVAETGAPEGEDDLVVLERLEADLAAIDSELRALDTPQSSS